MFEAGSWLWRWLADQPPFIEVGIGMSFVLVLAPMLLAAVALPFTGRITVSFFAANSKRLENEIALPDRLQ